MSAASRFDRVRHVNSKSSALAGATFKDWLRIAGLLAARAGMALRRGLGAPVRAAIGLGRRRPERLLIAPQDIRTSDPTLAADIYAGYFAFGTRFSSHATNDARVKFALMWANHDWYDIQGYNPADNNLKLLYPGKVTPATWDKICDLVIARYFRHRALARGRETLFLHLRNEPVPRQLWLD